MSAWTPRCPRRSLPAAPRHWRNRKRRPCRIFDRLGSLAARAASRLGVEIATEALGVDAATRRWCGATEHRQRAEPQFLELTPLPVAAQTACCIELDESSGRKLKCVPEGGAVAHAAESLAVLRKDADS